MRLDGEEIFKDLKKSSREVREETQSSVNSVDIAKDKKFEQLQRASPKNSTSVHCDL